MTNARRLPASALHLYRPAIAEARLMTDKQARDAVYVATLAEELAAIDRKLAAMEQALSPETLPNRDAASAPGQAPGGERSAQWIRTKCRELDSRLHRIASLEKNSLPSRAPARRQTPPTLSRSR
jgi:hypothetical protein